MNVLLSNPAGKHEVDLLKHIDLEKICSLYDMFFTRHSTYDYVLPLKRMVATKDNFEFYKIKLPFIS